jgi:hypothetical protein
MSSDFEEKILILLKVFGVCILARCKDQVLFLNPSVLKKLSLEDLAESLNDGTLTEEEMLSVMEAIDYARKESAIFPNSTEAQKTATKENND